MNFKAASELLETIQPYTENSDIVIESDNESDLIFIDKNNNIGFEVTQNEIIVFYFTDHCHFEDYTFELSEGEDNYVKRAEDFLLELFRYKVRHTEIFKGKKLYCEKYFLIYSDGRKDNYIGGTWYILSRLFNPFGRKTVRTDDWRFDKSKGCFKNVLEDI